MRLTFRAKLTFIVGTAALAFVLLIVASSWLNRRVEAELTSIQQRYVPRVEWGPKLKSHLEHISRSLQDAVAAEDADLLDEARAKKDRLMAELDIAQRALGTKDVASVQVAVEDYFRTAMDVSTRLVAGETGEALVISISEMQRKYRRALDIVERTTNVDKRELTSAFSGIKRAQDAAQDLRLMVSVFALVSVLLFSWWLSRGWLRTLRELSSGFARFGGGAFHQPIKITSNDELGDAARQANQMAESLRQLAETRDRDDWLKAGHAGLVKELRGDLEPATAAAKAVHFIARYLDAPVGALYYIGENQTFHLLGQYALSAPNLRPDIVPSFLAGEGLVGQVALQADITVISDPPPNYLRVRSGLGDTCPRAIVLLPLLRNAKTTGVLELALLKPWSDLFNEFLIMVRETLAIALDSAHSRASMRDLLTATQRQAERLKTQEEELRTTNEELQTQQEELRQTNEELAHQADELEAQRRALEERNAELTEARQHLEQKADEISRVSSYKSQFLANMSHELRTPLNSMLLLSNLMAENKSQNLTKKQVEFCKTIHSAGKDLLALINQVLDLSKIEAGKQEIRIDSVSLYDIAQRARNVFEPLARDKGLSFEIEIEPDLPETIVTDGQRVDQILNNLVGNAIKFTERGEVRLRMRRATKETQFHRKDLTPEEMIELSVSDTGVGIDSKHLDRVFAPFEQVDSAPDRRYGGTGLGLTIARELCWLLGGELQLRSALGKGSTFACYLPERPTFAGRSRREPVPSQNLLDDNGSGARDDRAAPPGERTENDCLLIIEDDPVFGDAVCEAVDAAGMTCVWAKDGRTGLQMANNKRPIGIILDVRLPDIDGWKVMEELRSNAATAKIPVHFVSAVEGADRGMAMGAVGYLTKPATRGELTMAVEALVPKRNTQPCRVLVLEQDVDTADSLIQELRREDLDATRATTTEQALEFLKREQFQCMILDLSLSDMDGLAFLEDIQSRCGPAMPSVIIYTARPMSKAEVTKLEAYAEAVVLKEGRSTERLIDEVRLFVHRLKNRDVLKRHAASEFHPADVKLEGRQVLVVDDDMRTVYALSAMLRAKGMVVSVADTGRVALDVLNEHDEIEAVLMDVMMPEMDGYEAMRQIRKNMKLQQLPIIALTAKAMRGDREKCIEAGATDYLSKPVDSNRLLTMLNSYLNDGALER